MTRMGAGTAAATTTMGAVVNGALRPVMCGMATTHLTGHTPTPTPG